MQATVQTSLRYVAPGNVASTLNITQTLSYVASNVGFLDVPEGTLADVSYTVPMGSITDKKGVLVQNNTDQALDVSINGSEDLFQLSAGAQLLISGPTASEITSVTLTTTATGVADGTIAYATLGDAAS